MKALAEKDRKSDAWDGVDVADVIKVPEKPKGDGWGMPDIKVPEKPESDACGNVANIRVSAKPKSGVWDVPDIKVPEKMPQQGPKVSTSALLGGSWVSIALSQ